MFRTSNILSKKAFFCALLSFFLINVTPSFSQVKNYTFLLNDRFGDTATIQLEYPDIYKALSVWESFIKTQNDSFLILKDRNDSNLKSMMKEQLFSEYFPKENIIFHVVDFERSGDNYIIENVIQNEWPEFNENSIISYFKIGARKEGNLYKLYFLFDDKLASLKKTDTKWITYYAPLDKPIAKDKIKLANKFCDSVAQAFNLKKRKVNYIVLDQSRAFEIFGHYFNWGATSQKFNARGQAFLIDNKTHGNFRHELVHFLFEDYTPVNIINEGLATWLAGPGNFHTFPDAVAELKKLQISDRKTLDKIINRAPPYWQGIYSYALGGLIIEHAFETGGKQLVMNIISDKENRDIYAIVKKHFNLNNQEPQEFLIDLIKNKNLANKTTKK